MTPEIIGEWNKHQSAFARRWRVAMESQKKVHRIRDVANDDLRAKVQEVAASKSDHEAMQKDVMLIEAAIATDQTIISIDETARRLFTEASTSISELRNVVWVNPSKETKVIFWLKNGAWPEKDRRLGFQVGER